MRHGILALTLLLGLSACDTNKNLNPSADPIAEFKDREAELRDNEIQVVDPNLNPIPNATVQIGQLTWTANSSGIVKIPRWWVEEENVNIKKSGFISTSYLNQMPQKAVYMIRYQTAPVRYEVKGNTSGYPDLKKDGWADFSLVIKPFTQMDVVTFDMSKIISDENDTMDVLGKTLELPSNIAVPQQKESYLFFTLNLDKPLYRTYFDTLGDKELIAHRGRFEVKTVVDKFRKGAAFYEVMNDLKFQSLEVTKLSIAGNTMKDLGTTAVTLTPQLTHKAPAFDPALLYFTTSLIKSGDTFIPADYKFYKPSESLTMLLGNTPANNYLISMYGEKKVGPDGKVKGLTPKMSLALSSTAEPLNTPLDTIQQPVIAANIATCVPPSKKEGVNPVGTYATISKVTTTIFENSMTENKEIVWESYAPNWVSQIQLPIEMVRFLEATPHTRFEITYLGSTKAITTPQGPLQFNDATHASRNALDY